MEINPFKYDSANPRFVTNAERPTTLYYTTAALFLLSLRFYQRKIFRIDNNVLNFGLFTVGSAFASYQYAATFLSSPLNEAAIQNNSNEQHK